MNTKWLGEEFECAYHGTPLDVDGECPKCVEDKTRWDALTPEQQQAERDRIEVANAAAREARRIERRAGLKLIQGGRA